MAQVWLDGIEKVFQGNRIGVRELSMTIADGELLVVLGPSGCGKSTLLRLLAGLEVPTAGRILFDGKVVNDLPPQRRNIAMVFQNYALYPHMTVRQNLEFPLRMLKHAPSDRKERTREVAEFLGLESLLDHKPRQLSGGQAQRVAMGRAIVRDPALFLLDEPLSNLDAKLRGEIRAVITDLHQRLQTTTVYVTHDQIEAMTMGHRIAVMRHGQLRQIGPPAQLYERPDDLFVASFLGSPTMNLIRVDDVSETEPVTVRVGRHRLPLPEASRASAVLASSRRRVRFMGLRPEAFSWRERDATAPVIDGEVGAVEALGHEQLLYLDTTARFVDVGATDCFREVGGRLVARLPAVPKVSPGERIRLAVDIDRLMWFDTDGKAVP